MERRFLAINQGLFVFHVACALALLLGIPLALRLGHSHLAWLAVGIALLSNGYWALLHETLHGNLFPQPAKNRVAGRTLALLFGSSYRLLRFGHLTHHAFNRHPLDRPDVYDPSDKSWAGAYGGFMIQILGGHYLGEILLPALFWAPKGMRESILDRVFHDRDPRLAIMRRQARTLLGSDKAVREIRTDSAIAIGAIAASFILWSQHWPWFLSALMIRAFLISVADNLYHYRTPIDRPEYSLSLRAPKLVQLLILNTNFHQTHHRSMHLPWWRLPEAFAREKGRFDGTFFTAILAQLRGPSRISALQSSS